MALTLALMLAAGAQAEGLKANFQHTDINEFINTVSKNLSKTIIIDPAVRGQISVRSYDELDNEQYYQFFLSVLEVHGFAAIEMKNGVVKVIPSKNAKGSAVPFVAGQKGDAGDELVTRVVQLQHVTAKELAPLLRQLNDSSAGGVVHFDPSNTLLMTGRAAVIKQLIAIVESVDLPADTDLEKVPLKHASASQVAEILNGLGRQNGQHGDKQGGKTVADPRTNTLLISGSPQLRESLRNTALSLDAKGQHNSNSRVFYLQHAKAENLVEVLTGVSTNLQNKTEGKAPAVSMIQDIVVKADAYTNSLIVNAPPDVMSELQEIITRLDISRSQVLVEAIIVEMQDADGMALGMQWLNKSAGGTQFNDTHMPISNLKPGGIGDAMKDVNGLATGFWHGNWSGLFTALQTNSQNNILATPSIVTLDNMEAEFTVGQNVPVLSGSQTTAGGHVFNSVERKDVGIKLKVKPQINQGDSVMMEIEQEVSSVNEMSGDSKLGVTFNTRLVKNAVLVGSSRTVVVGGLLDTSNSNTQNSVPFLGRIPLLGKLFSSDSDKRSKRNLMLFIRPTIIRQQESFDRTSDRQLEKFRHEEATSRPASKADSALDRQLSQKLNNQALNSIREKIADFYAAEQS
ncbi:type II secretion system secretin GspD [Erwinia sp. E602]|uniref:type II secretion system secretin GspD n=1 Tax=Erwinia sp. E602 TaxID=2675378 RepID=UPI002013BC08|nr:type II secretion system secretin GspD [Erwinia sp. E602]